MRAMSWYQQQGEKNMSETYDPGDTGLPYHPTSHPQSTPPCVTFVPARAAHHQIETGVLVPPDQSPDVIDGVYVTDVHPKFVRLGVGHADGQMSYAGRWDKETLKAFGEALLKLSEYME